MKNSILINLAGREFRLKPTFQAIMDMEERTGSLLALAIKMSDGGVDIKEITAVIWACMEERLSYNEVGMMVLDEGIAKMVPVVRDLLTLCLSGGGQSEDTVSPGKS